MTISEIQQWATTDVKTIVLTQDIGGACYSLRVREFVPLEGDALDRTWSSGLGKFSHPCAPYAIENMRETCPIISKYVDDNVMNYVAYWIDRTDTLLRKTYEMAYEYSLRSDRPEERAVLSAVLRLWVASRMESKPERICGLEVLGMTPQDWDPQARNYNMYLIPPVLQAQIEILVTATVLIPMKDIVLKKLQFLIEKNLIKSWFTIYLAIFLLLHSCALLTRAEAYRAVRNGKTGLKSSYYNYQVVEEFHNGAKIMLAYFHYCNKGSHPFGLNWGHTKSTSFAQLDAQQIEFLKETIELVEEKRQHFREIRERKVFTDDYYFISQLYDIDWAPTHTV
ncbi:hypothetical protein Hte_005565 [Hypoxylon texense]